MVVREPQAAGDYDDRTTAAVKSVLIEIGQILGSFEGKFAIIGGAVPWLLLTESLTGTRCSLDWFWAHGEPAGSAAEPTRPCRRALVHP